MRFDLEWRGRSGARWTAAASGPYGLCQIGKLRNVIVESRAHCAVFGRFGIICVGDRE